MNFDVTLSCASARLSTVAQALRIGLGKSVFSPKCAALVEMTTSFRCTWLFVVSNKTTIKRYALCVVESSAGNESL